MVQMILVCFFSIVSSFRGKGEPDDAWVPASLATISPVGRYVVLRDFVALFQSPPPGFKQINPLSKKGKILLLMIDLGIELGNGAVLHRNQAFQLADSVFHGANPTRLPGSGEWIHPLLR
jgi:hypothetical protein